MISEPAVFSEHNVTTRQNLLTELDKKFNELPEGKQKVVVYSELVGVGKHYFVHDYSKQRGEKRKYKYIIWFDKFYDLDEVRKRLEHIKRDYLEEDSTARIADVLTELIQRYARNRKILLILNCGYFDYEELSDARDIINNTLKIAPDQVDVILISRVDQSACSENLVIGKMDDKAAESLMGRIFKNGDFEIKTGDSLEEITKACLHHPTLITQYSRHKIQNPSCKKYKSAEGFPFPFLDEIFTGKLHVASPTLPEISSSFDFHILPELSSGPKRNSLSFNDRDREMLSSFSRSSLVNKISYRQCVSSAISLANKEFKKVITIAEDKICIFYIINHYLLSERKKEITKSEIDKICAESWRVSELKISNNFINVAKKYFLICTHRNQDGEEIVVFEDVVSHVLKSSSMSS